jgi:elongation factor Ts
MTDITIDLIKELRERSGAGVLSCKKALEAAQGDIEEAHRSLREKGLAKAAKKADREAKEGLIGVYLHAGNRVAALVELSCETDFVARTEEFGNLAHDLAMQVVAASPLYVSVDDVPAEVLEETKTKYREELEAEGKPEHIVNKAIEGKLRKFYVQACVLEQQFIKDEDKTVGELIQEAIALTGENIVLRRFVRFEVGS